MGFIDGSLLLQGLMGWLHVPLKFGYRWAMLERPLRNYAKVTNIRTMLERPHVRADFCTTKLWATLQRPRLACASYGNPDIRSYLRAKE